MGRKPKLPDHTSGELTEYFDLDFCEQLGVEIGIEDFNELQVRLNIAGKHYQLALVSPPKSEQQKLIKLFNQKLNELDEIILNLGIPEINRLDNCALPGFSFSNLSIQVNHAKHASELALRAMLMKKGAQPDISLYVFIFWLYLAYRQLTRKKKKYAYTGQYEGEVINYLEKCLNQASVFKSKNTIGDKLKEILSDPGMSDYIDHAS